MRVGNACTLQLICIRILFFWIIFYIGKSDVLESPNGMAIIAVNTECCMGVLERISDAFEKKKVPSSDAILTNSYFYRLSAKCSNQKSFLVFLRFGNRFYAQMKSYILSRIWFGLCKPLKILNIVVSLFRPRRLDSVFFMEGGKRVGILNFQFETNNFGAVLVPYSLQSILSKLGFRAYIINFDPSFFSRFTNKKKFFALCLGYKFVKFKYDFLNLSDLFVHASSLSKLNGFTDVFIFGSDQIWKQKITRENYASYYGDFADDSKKLIAYAASFGSGIFEEISQENTLKCGELLHRFSSVSVREESGVKICFEHFGVDAQCVLDPVLLNDPSDLAPIYSKSDFCGTGEPYIALHELSSDNGALRVAVELSKMISMPFISISTFKRRILGRTMNFMNSPADWIQGIRHSELVVTDSFHCVVCAIIFQKQFIAVRYMSDPLVDRFENLLGKLGLSDRLVSSVSEVLTRNILNKKIDYSKVEPLLSKERGKSLEFLVSALFK